ncbi:MAG: hypothetical protein KJ871_14230 [Alphaproteobacteria bacterium]|nr:hypothetical protein [Alphaproteobacteria bacterium]MBU2084995.1 hypothetical protein [Alphaproteobacteria bacterium]MBU2143927.1 hypothetical protein [Alphaproteobacteria bacterium]MBU2198042.1 hypothetical protein [Alphaproteobacteria bacterium]
MSWTEIRTLGSLMIAIWAVWLLQTRFIDGWQVVDLPPDQMLSTYVTVIIGMIVGEILVTTGVSIAGSVLNDATVASADFEDERDQQIERRAGIISHWFIITVVNVLALRLIMQETYSSSVLSPLAIVSTSGIVFTLLAVLFAAHIVKMVATLVLYRI